METENIAHLELSEEEQEMMKQGLKELDELFGDSKEFHQLKLIFEKNLIETTAIAFNNFQKVLEVYLTKEKRFVLLNSLLNYNDQFLKLFKEKGASETTLSGLKEMFMLYSSRFQSAFFAFRMSAMKDWTRINTEINLRQNVLPFLESIILRRDGSSFEFSGNITSYCILVDHLLRQIVSVVQVLGEEPTLLGIPRNLLERSKKIIDDLLEQHENISDLTEQLKLENEE